MKFSIIIPARNEEAYLAKTLKSIENQDYPDYETIVIVNACTDNTHQIAQKYADKTILTKKPGVSHARNLGAQKANGATLIFLDADTTLGPNLLNQIKSKFNQKYSVGTVKVKPNAPKLIYRSMMAFKNLTNLFKAYPWTAGLIYCRKSDFIQFDEKLNIKETIYFVRKMLKKGQFQFLNQTHVTTSMRRYEKWGSLKLVSFFIKKWFKSFFSNVKGDPYPVIR